MRLLFINLLPDKLIVRQVANEDFLKVKSTQRDRGGVLFITLIYSLRRRTESRCYLNLLDRSIDLVQEVHVI